MRIVHVITGLGTGGAETTLHRILSDLESSECRNYVIGMTRQTGPARDAICALGIPVYCLGMQNGWPDPRALARLALLLRQLRPDLVQTWMYHANLLGGLGALAVPGVPSIWNIRRGRLDARADKRGTRWTSRACALLSGGLPERIVCCSEASRSAHIDAGYAARKMMVIPNGFDVERFRPDPAAHQAVRAELGIGPEEPLIGMVARFDPPKDHATFALAAGRLGSAQARFLLCGEGVEWSNERLAGWLRDAGIASRCLLLGRRTDVPRLMAALDLAISCSRIEGFPNVLGEAMACGVPCVATDAGDSALLIGDTGRVVPAGAPEALAAACLDLLAQPQLRARLGQAARARITERFSLRSAAGKYRELYEDVATHVRNRRVH